MTGLASGKIGPCFVSISISAGEILELLREIDPAIGDAVTLEDARAEMQLYGRSLQLSLDSIKHEMLYARVRALRSRLMLGVGR